MGASRLQEEEYVEAIDLVRSAPLAGMGYGLPIARLYARYFGGDLKVSHDAFVCNSGVQVFPMLGFGTDAHLHVKAFQQSNGVLPA